MNEIAVTPAQGPIDRTICLPGSKSLTNRALVAAALSGGLSQLNGALFADDTRHMMDSLADLGVAIDPDPLRFRVRVQGCRGRWPNTEAELLCGNAGTVVRFLTACCCLGQGQYRIDGISRMRERPIGPLVAALRGLGATISYVHGEGHCPIVIRASGLKAGSVSIQAEESSQFLSALLLAAPLASGDVLIEVDGPLTSAPFVRMTLAVMEAFGVSFVEDEMRRFIIPGMQSYSATDFDIEPDATAASYFFAAAALTGGRVTVDGLGLHTVQGDAAFVDILADMGCDVERTEHGTTVRGPRDGKLRGVDVDLNAMPDVAPTLAVLAAFAEDPTRIRNVANLRIKESDRIAALAAELGNIGSETDILPDGLVIHPARSPHAAGVNTHEDHRLAMSFALAGLRMDGVVIRDPECVAKTFPEFFEIWNDITG